MSLAPVSAHWRVLIVGVAIAVPAVASAQDPEQGTERFFFDQPEKKSERETTLLRGSIVSTSFYYRETAAAGAPYNAGDAAPLTASPFDRLFSDLRLQMTAQHISGGDWDFRGDVRGRYNTGGTRLSDNTATSPYEGQDVPVQSGTFSGNELDIREFYVTKAGLSTDFHVGRQYALELAGTKFDGLGIKHRKNEHITYLVFAGAYPTRGSRDIREDYPRAAQEDEDAGPGKRIMPAVGGGGLAYRYDRYHGAIGGVAILPLADDLARFQGTGTQEKPRVFATANGYYRRSTRLDLFHFAVLDVASADGAGLRNLTVGANYQPDPALRLFVDVTRVDAETLNIQAQTKLDNPDPTQTVAVQNNIEVLRIASESARAGVSSAFKRNRYQLSVFGTLRRRPEIILQPRGLMLDPNSALPPTVLQEQRAADITVRAVDRQLLEKYRVGVTGSRTFPIGDANVARTKVLLVHADVSTEMMDGKAELEGNVSFVDAEDDRRGDTCANLTDLTSCFGTANARTYGIGGLAFYRFKPEWFFIGSLNLGYQVLTAANAAGAPEEQPAILSATAFARIAYRF